MFPNEYDKLDLCKLPHVVILGAGASCASTPKDEKRGRQLPMMNQLPEILELKDLLSSEQLENAKDNFEKFYSELVLGESYEISTQIEQRLYDYFASIELSDELTLYEKLIFSLRKKDVIATFNWDPLLGYAFRRNSSIKCLPHILFLHGNVLQGVCEEHKRLGWNDDSCAICGEQLKPTQLLYPVESKNYEKDSVISSQWKLLDDYLSDAFFVTIFGYSAPLTDISARERIIEKIIKNSRKDFLQLEIIDLHPEELIEGNLIGLKDEGIHCNLINSFEKSWLCKHPKFTCEALYQAVMQQDPIAPIPFPVTDNLGEYLTWNSQLVEKFPFFLTEGNEKQG